MKSYKPTTPSRRFITNVDYGVLSAISPLKKFLKRLHENSGRNFQGRITVRHQSSGVKRLYRLIDFKQNKLDISAKIEAIEYDPYRSAFIARLLYKNGERNYILASKNMKVDDEIIVSENAPLKEGNRLKLKNILIGYLVYNIELQRNKGGQLARSAGSYAEVLAQENGFTNLKLSSGEIRKVAWDNFASLGQVSNPDHNLIVIGKAGRSRLKGVRPTVRGSAMNPRDHPYGGGEGRAHRGTKRPKTKWGKITGGRKTRKKKRLSNKYIIKRRK